MPFAASIDCWTVKPPLASSVIAAAASDADVPGREMSLPSAFARSPATDICCSVARVTACRVFIVVV
ncbi:hypothetical protein ASG84_26370 [Rhodococcus sp. Leaf278]|nr:hypothetical protein ASG84_26370 [Rhodococcus sp. Leaf278]